MNEKQRQSQQWLGSIVDDVFRLEQCLGEGGAGAVFRTAFSRRPATIKLIPADRTDPPAQLAAWQSAAKLNHPHLVRILASGQSTVQGTPVLYIVTEYADETMAEVLAERLLTPTEARDVMATVLDSLAYLHSKGLVHGHIKASNFLAVGDSLKFSVDSVTPGDPLEDVRHLGGVFQNALAKPLPQPFLDITAHAVDPNPQTRWTVAEIATRLDGRMPQRQPERKPAIWRYVLPAAAIVIAAVVFLLARRGHRETPTIAPVPAPAVAQVAPPATQVPAPHVEPAPTPPPETTREKKRRAKSERRASEKSAAPAASASSATASAGGEGPLPDVPATAIRTIRGKVTIPVRVDVDASGKVTDAKLESRTGSRYFAGFALKSARQWKFQPSGSPATWILRFVFTRQDTKVSSARVHP